MSFHQWSKYDLVSSKQHRQTDHWSKLRCKSFRLCTLPTGQTFTYCTSNSEGTQRHSRPKDSMELYRGTIKKHAPHGTLALTGNPFFNKYLVNQLLTAPSSPQYLRESESRDRAPSSYSQRAKLGHKYWIDDPYQYNSSPGKNVTLGSRGTFLGIGVPRL